MLSPVPLRDAIADVMLGRPVGAFVRESWTRWLNSLLNAVNSMASRLGGVTLTAQHAAVSATAVSTPTLTQGLYRLSYAVGITTAATVSSSVAVTLGWTSGGVAMSQSFAALTGNTTATQQSGIVMAQVDANTTVTYSTAYASSGATAMRYTLSVTVEQMP